MLAPVKDFYFVYESCCLFTLRAEDYWFLVIVLLRVVLVVPYTCRRGGTAAAAYVYV